MFSYRLSPRQKEILRFLTEHHRSTGLIPSIREVQHKFKFASSNAVAQHLLALEKKGFLVRTKGKARCLTFPTPVAPNGLAPNGTSAPLKDDIQLQLAQLVLETPKAKPLPESIELDNRTKIFPGDALAIMQSFAPRSIHAIVTDPPYGLIEFDEANHSKLRSGRGGVWRIPPSFDGSERSPLPRFTVLTAKDRERLYQFFYAFGLLCRRVLEDGGHIIIASNPLLSTLTFSALSDAGLEKRGEVIRLVTTLRGGDRPKGAENEFPEVSVMPRSCWEPWGLFRKPLGEGTVAANLRRRGTGAFRRISENEPFKDLVTCPPARGEERTVASHPSLKPQKLMRYLVRASLPLGRGIVLDPFCGSGSTLAAASNLGYDSIGIERDPQYLEVARAAFPILKALKV